MQETLNTIPDLESVNPARIQELAQRYLRPDAAWRTTIVSKSLAPET